MAIHDAYARRTPFELAFRDRERAAVLAQAVREEAAGRGIDAGHPHMFVTLGSVGAFLREIQEPEAPPELVHAYAMLAYHAVSFERAGGPVYLLSRDAAGRLVDRAPEAAPEPPDEAGYLQLPQHLFWAEGTSDEVPESIDGMFWTIGSEGAVLHTLLVTGMRPDRPGLGVTPMPDAPLSEASSWLTAAVRPNDEDFTSGIPGAEIDGLYGVRAAGEPLKLLARFFAHLAVAGARPRFRHGPADPPPDGPVPSALPFGRVGRHQDSEAADGEEAAGG